jgi:type IV secretion system protein VirB10
MGGHVDNKYWEAFSTAILTSSLDVGVAAVGDALFGNQQQTTTVGPDGGTTTTSSPTSTAMQQAVQNVGTVGQSIVGSVVNLQPTIYVDQGEQINIFVNKDVVFPIETFGGGAGFIP